MKYLRKKINAFTLTEVIIAMIISSLGIGFCLLIIMNIRKMIFIKHGNDRVFEAVVSLNTAFRNDVDKCDSVNIIDSDICLWSDSTNKRYIIHDKYIVRIDNAVIDTFMIPHVDAEFENINRSSLLSSIRLRTSITNFKELTYYKNYSAEILVNTLDR